MNFLSDIMRTIDETYQFTPENYPALKDMTMNQRKAFICSHSAHHMMKSLGKISAQCETFDHGDNLDSEIIKEVVIKMIINSLKLASEMGIDVVEIGRAIPEYMRSS